MRYEINVEITIKFNEVTTLIYKFFKIFFFFFF